VWFCQYQGCRSTPEQIETLRSRRPGGFPHDEDSSLSVCTVCRRLPLKEQQAACQERLDAAFVAGIGEELASIDENEDNIQALSQVFRYYAKHAKQLSQVLFEFMTKQCFPWELIHALHLVDDILLMDNTGRYKVELVQSVEIITVTAFRKAQSDLEKKEIVKMLRAWQDLRVFDSVVFEACREAVRSSSAQGGQIFDEAAETAVDEEEEIELAAPEASPVASSPSPSEEAPLEGPNGDCNGSNSKPPAAKRKREDASVNGSSGEGAEDDASALQPPVTKKVGVVSTPKVAANKPLVLGPNAGKVQALVERIMFISMERPFEVLGLAEPRRSEEPVKGHDIRKAYRRIALLIHPDKNHGFEVRCQEALIKLQQSRENAETELQRIEITSKAQKGETRSAAKCTNATMDAVAGHTCKYPGCDLPPCKQCANGCCTRNITHCHFTARSKAGQQCFFHPPPRAWARNA